MSVATAEAQSGTAQPVPPPPPATVQETGLHPDTLAQLMLKTLVAGEMSGTALADKLRLPYSVLEALIQHARAEKLVEVRGASGAGSAEAGVFIQWSTAYLASRRTVQRAIG